MTDRLHAPELESDPLSAEGRSWYGYLLNQLAEQIRDATVAALRPLELTPPMVRVLGNIDAPEAVTQISLAERTHIDRTSMSQILDHFEALGYARRAAHPSDRRANAVLLTEKGHRALADATDRARTVERQFLGCLDPAEQKDLHRLLLKLHSTDSPCKEIFQ